MHYHTTLSTLLLALLPLALAIPQPQGGPDLTRSTTHTHHTFTLHHERPSGGFHFPTGGFFPDHEHRHHFGTGTGRSAEPTRHHHRPTRTGGHEHHKPTGTGEHHYKPTGTGEHHYEPTGTGGFKKHGGGVETKTF